MLDTAGTPYNTNPQLVRGLDYYSRTTFEVTSDALGSQNAICGGGRYDSLVEEFEGPSTPCFGFALGMERLISLLDSAETDALNSNPDLFVVCMGETAVSHSLNMIHELRTAGISVERDYEGASMKSQMRKANKFQAQFVLILGDNEIESGQYSLKNMANSEQIEVSADSLLETLKGQLG
jgi:histidyl-tRNA synthetase